MYNAIFIIFTEERKMPRTRKIETDVEPVQINGLWYCGLCNEQKGQSKRDCKYHQASCLNRIMVKNQDAKFGIICAPNDEKLFLCKYCKYSSYNKDNIYRHVETKHTALMPVGEKRLFLRNKEKKVVKLNKQGATGSMIPYAHANSERVAYSGTPLLDERNKNDTEKNIDSSSSQRTQQVFKINPPCDFFNLNFLIFEMFFK